MANIPEEKMDEIKERYELYDKIGDGKVEASMVINVLRSLDLNPLTGDINKILADSELVGKRVEIEQFCSIYDQIANQPGQAKYEDIMEAFKTYDRDNQGEIQVATFRQVLVNIGDILTEEEAEIITKKYEDPERMAIPYQAMVKDLLGSSAA